MLSDKMYHKLPKHNVKLCSGYAGTLADRDEEAVYQAAGVTSRSDATAPAGAHIQLELHDTSTPKRMCHCFSQQNLTMRL